MKMKKVKKSEIVLEFISDRRKEKMKILINFRISKLDIMKMKEEKKVRALEFTSESEDND